MKVIVKRIPCRKKPAPDAAEQARMEQERNERVWKDQLNYKEEYDLTEVSVEAIEDYIAHSTHIDENGKKKILLPKSFLLLWFLSF